MECGSRGVDKVNGRMRRWEEEEKRGKIVYTCSKVVGEWWSC